MGKTMRERLDRVESQKTCRVNLGIAATEAPRTNATFLDLVRPNGERVVYGGECQPRLSNRDYFGFIV
jgi:hypothetical protein